MKKLVLIFSLFFLSALGASAQDNPVTWAYFAKKTSATEATIYLRATIDDKWHLYSQYLKPGGPQKTIIAFTPSKDFTLVGKTNEPKPTTYFDKNFKMEVSYFADEVIFTQKVKLNKKETTVKGKIEFMVCDDKQCLPPDEVTFSIPVK